jgi:hypothetical protein
MANGTPDGSLLKSGNIMEMLISINSNKNNKKIFDHVTKLCSCYFIVDFEDMTQLSAALL